MGFNIGPIQVNTPSLGSIANAAVNYLTLGQVGFDEEHNRGSVNSGLYGRQEANWTNAAKQGVENIGVGAWHAGDEFLGSITGRNIQRDALALSESRLAATDLQRAKDIKDAQTKNQQDDMNASNSASAASAATGPGGPGGPTAYVVRSGPSSSVRSSNFQPLGDQNAFLGI